MKRNLNPIKGTKEYLPKESRMREFVRQKILEVYQKNGYQLISTPILEHLNLLEGSEGGDNLKMMFKTIKRGEKLNLKKENLSIDDITEEGLRYDLTVPLSRFYANNRESLICPFKAIQIDKSFRAEKPQLGRYREFTQCDIDVFGDKTHWSEIDLLITAFEAYAKLGFNSLIIKINDRRLINCIIKNAGFLDSQIQNVARIIDKLADLGFDGVIRELRQMNYEEAVIIKLVDKLKDVVNRGIDSVDGDAEVISNLKDTIDIVNGVVHSIIETVAIEENRKIDPSKFYIQFDITIVRGQGYYTGMVFEAYTDDGFLRAVGGGGRYDKMINKMIGIDVPAVGFSMGFDPITMLLMENDKIQFKRSLIALFYENEKMCDVLLAKQVLKQQYDVSIFKKPKNMKNFIDKLKQNGFSGFAFVDTLKINKL